MTGFVEIAILAGIVLLAALECAPLVRPRRFVRQYVARVLRYVLHTDVRVEAARLRLSSLFKTSALFPFRPSSHYALSIGGSIEAVDMPEPSRAIRLKRLRVADPPGFGDGCAFEIDEVAVLFRDETEIFSSTPAISEIRLTGLRVELRHSAGRGTNIGTLLREARRVCRKRRFRQPPSVRRTYVVECLACDGACVHVETGVPDVPGIKIETYPFRVRGIGGDRAVTIGEIVVALLERILEEGVDLGGFLRPVAGAVRDELRPPFEHRPHVAQRAADPARPA